MKETIDELIAFLNLKGSAAVELKYKLLSMTSDLTTLLDQLRAVDFVQGEEQYKGLINELLNLIKRSSEN